ncbi:MAG TPA: hypothetical protein VH208_09320, partial [Myxococcaceae bacterium]|nr:hypothetical protein [Myxococcaceae bacterium]
MKRADAVALVGLALAVAGAYGWYEQSTRIDSDRHFHRAVSRLASGLGYVKTLPQVEDMGWGQRFPDKEYLFHVFSTWGLRLAGEVGFRLSALLWAALALWALYALCRLALSPPYAFAVTIAAGLANAYWAYRLMLVRPLVLAIAAALWLAVGLLTRRRWLTALSAAVFILGYHAIYVPLLIILVVAGAHRFDRDARRTALAGVIGLAVGIVLNPYFPSTVQMMIGQISVALTGGGAKGIGVEVQALSTAEFLRLFAGPLVATLFCIGRPWLFPSGDPGARRQILLLIGLALAFWGLAFWTPRAGEYAVPFSAVALAHGVADLSRRMRTAAVGLVLALQVPSHLADHQPTPSDRYEAAVAPAIEHLPREAAGKKVLNCAFDEGSTLLDLRPDVRFVDAMDATALEGLAPQLAKAREDLEEGRAGEPWWIAHDLFRAQFVLCGYPAAIEAMDADPRFARIYPPRGSTPRGPHHDLFAVREGAIPAVRRFEVLGEHGPLGQLRLSPDQVMLDLQRSPMPRGPGGCLRVRPLLEDPLVRPEVAVLGGGPRIVLRAGERTLYETVPPLTRARW